VYKQIAGALRLAPDWEAAVALTTSQRISAFSQAAAHDGALPWNWSDTDG
jgi:hypothetical protein